MKEIPQMPLQKSPPASQNSGTTMANKVVMNLRSANETVKATRKLLSMTWKGKSPPAMGGVKKPHQFWPGTMAFCEICQYQKSFKLLIH